jgi:hypothetical protein
MMNWNVFQTSPNKIFNVPVISTIWLGQLVTEWMIEKGAHPPPAHLSSTTASPPSRARPAPPDLPSSPRPQAACPTSRTSPSAARACSTT